MYKSKIIKDDYGDYFFILEEYGIQILRLKLDCINNIRVDKLRGKIIVSTDFIVDSLKI